MSKFYTYSQNNSGGEFTLDKKNGITNFVIIEAENEDDANTRAEYIGLYFDGVEYGVDFACCGDRLGNSPSECDEPLVYGQKPYDFISSTSIRWMEKGFNIAIHYINGKVEWL